MPHTQQFLSQNAASPESASQLISGEEEVKLWGSWVAWEQAWKGFLQILNILHTIPTTGRHEDEDWDHDMLAVGWWI